MNKTKQISKNILKYYSSKKIYLLRSENCTINFINIYHPIKNPNGIKLDNYIYNYILYEFDFYLYFSYL